MRLKQLSLQGFRNLSPMTREMSGGDVFAFVGQNGQGKSNFLEAIYLLAFSKSFRTVENADWVNFSADFCRLSGQVDSKKDGSTTLEIVVTRQPPEKGMKVNGVRKKAIDFIGHLNVVFFSPDSLDMVNGAPALRRRYLDLLLIQSTPDYLADLMAYHAWIKQRNALLKQIKKGAEKSSSLDVWDEKMIPIGFRIGEKRRQLAEILEPTVDDFYAKISGENEPISLKYHRSGGDSIVRENDFADAVFHFRPRDIELGISTIGPHRDDFVFFKAGKSLDRFGSRGEWRSLVLALKLAEIERLKTALGDSPVLLLDDVFSELDDVRQGHLLQAIDGCQTFLSTTHESFLEKIGSKKTILRVHEGAILP